MNYEFNKRSELSADQAGLLIEVINDQNGHGLSFEEFTDQVLMLFEDIPGFERISDSESQSITNQLWSLYHG